MPVATSTMPMIAQGTNRPPRCIRGRNWERATIGGLYLGE
jgi:hypothetical protein